MAEPEYLFWLDVESSGLLEETTPPTLLEFSWTITDPDGVQLTPLRQRFTALSTRGISSHRRDVPPPLHLPEPDGEGGGYWESGPYPSDWVRKQHAANGLADEWIRADETRAHRVLRDWAEVERLWLDDMEAAGMPTGRAYILAGGGVSHYEDRFVRVRAPRVFTPARFHYGLADVSTVLRVNHLRDKHWPKRADAALALARAAEASTTIELAEPDYQQIEVAADGYDGDDLTADGWDNGPQWGDLAEDPHRAAPGIARALMAYRTLPFIPTWLAAGVQIPPPPAPAPDSVEPDSIPVG